MDKARQSIAGRWLRLSRERRLLLAEAIAVLAAASAAVRWLPFRRAVGLGSRRLGRHAPSHDVLWAIEAAARAAPWRAVCFQKGLAVQWMLRRRGVDARLHYGIGRDEDGELHAHVWVAEGELIIIGGDEAARFKRVASFP